MTSIYASGTTASSSTSGANLLRISGMASGIDTDAVVKSMVSNYQSKIDKANQAKQTLQWQQESYRGIISSIKGLQDYFDPLSSKYMLSGNSFNTNGVTNTNSSIATGASNSAAMPGTYTVNVQKLAEQAKLYGKSQNSMITVSAASAANWTGKTLTFDDTTASVVDSKGVITTAAVNSKVVLSSLTSSTPKDLVTEINSKIAASNLNGKITASYVNDGTNEYIKLTKASSNTDTIKLIDTDNTIDDIKDMTINSGISSASKLSDLGISKPVSFTLSYDAATNTKPITIEATSDSTIKSLMDKVNSATGGEVTMSIDDTTGKVSFLSKDFGSTSSIKITNNTMTTAVAATTATAAIPAVATDNIITMLGLSQTTTIGKDALVDVTEPGQTIPTTTTQNSNKFTINGVAYSLVSKGSASITVTSNSDTVVTNMKKFIEDYNAIVSTINTKLTEKKDKNYAPLTDAQRTSMSADQITTWETKAKVGILRKDDNLTNLMTQLRGTLYSPVYSSYNSADATTGKVSLKFGTYGTGAIGIDTSTDYSDGGKLVITDEKKLKDAIENNMGEFKKMFIGASSTDLDTTKPYAGSKKYNEDGIFTRMDNIMRDYVASPGLGKDGTYSLSGYMNIFVNKQYDFGTSGTSGKNTLSDQVYNKTLSISKFQTQLNDASTRYYAKFTALEKAMNKLNSQQSSLSSMLGTSS
ncbi:flagellar filament capping protein FliD [Clostridium estertheticum]|uniref:Flagellar hook-associated protein 2 n=1 Tax=Clostridium estertheticum TaxID=238834 RepID=A0A7Y3SVF1_9CLOT|nr:flagellar filament capping protein FliD [Clostridium estertheticum]NNU76044.1 flagellar filament capping protein FliD [Clostridium estertheticum]WBL46372.1 flagellar filament capping protein FliD [Clostridium estertheticum]